jgi:imidazolonepropionase-like amidohydrolase
MLTLLLAAACLSSPAPQAEFVAVRCGEFWPEPSAEVQSNVVLLIREGKIQQVLAAGEQLPPVDQVHDLSEAFVMPGWIDCHVHLTGELSRKSRLEYVTLSEAAVTLRTVMHARRTVEAGFTTVRDLGADTGAIFAVRDSIQRGEIPGPRILAAGSAVTPSGGHGDPTHGYRETLFDLPGISSGVADGVPQCRAAVRHQVRRGADVIKLTATGGVLSETAAGTDQQFFDDELKAIIDTAHMLGRRVAAHAHGPTGMAAALRAGVDSIEHGSFLNQECLALFLEKGAWLVPTLHAGQTVVTYAGDPDWFPEVIARKARMVGPVMMRSLGRAHKAGVRIAFGTDCGVGAHGLNAEEFSLMVRAGMSPTAALTSATTGAAELCGLAASHGKLAPGYVADLVALSADPRGDIGLTEKPLAVMRAGRLALWQGQRIAWNEVQPKK